MRPRTLRGAAPAVLAALVAGSTAGAPPLRATPAEPPPSPAAQAPGPAGAPPAARALAIQTPAPGDPGRELLAVADRWFEALLETYPFFATEIGDHRFDDRFDLSIDEAVRARLGEVARECRRELARIDREALPDEDRLTYDLLARRLESTLAGLAFPDHLLPVDYLESSPPIALHNMASPQGIHPFESVADHDAFLARMAAFPRWMELAIANMRRGMEKGVVPPRGVIEPAVLRLGALLAPDPRESPLFRPVADLPAAVPPRERRRLEKEYERTIGRRVTPALERLRDFLRDEYLPRCRTSLSWSALPEGEAWYRHLVRRETSTGLSPEEIHALGRGEVARIVGELEALAEREGHGGVPALFERLRTDPAAFLEGPEAVVEAYGAIRRRVEEALPRLFPEVPEAELHIHPVTLEESAYLTGETYVPGAPDGSRPGTFYVTVRGPYRRAEMESLFLHEGLPGHHLQLSLAREIDALPRFRRFGHEVAYVEGWALYAESLGPELGLYRDPAQQAGRLASALLRAARLVLDTGLHHRGWSAREAVETARREALGAGAGEIVRYATIPAQALAYKVGELRLKELRREAEESLGPSFDPREFHHEILRHGPLPLDLLEREVRRWIAGRAPPEPAGRVQSPHP